MGWADLNKTILNRVKGVRLKIKDSFLNRPPISHIMTRFKKSYLPHLKSVF